MIDINQLCRGFAVSAHGNVALVHQIFDKSVSLISKRYPGGDNCYGVNPLPLTQEALTENLGFKRQDSMRATYQCPQGKLLLAKYQKGFAVVHPGLEFGPYFTSVHELQLYYLGMQYGVLDFDPKWENDAETISLSSCSACGDE